MIVCTEIKQKQPQDRKTIFETLSLPVARSCRLSRDRRQLRAQGTYSSGPIPWRIASSSKFCLFVAFRDLLLVCHPIFHLLLSVLSVQGLQSSNLVQKQDLLYLLLSFFFFFCCVLYNMVHCKQPSCHKSMFSTLSSRIFVFVYFLSCFLVSA